MLAVRHRHGVGAPCTATLPGHGHGRGNEVRVCAERGCLGREEGAWMFGVM